MEAKINAIIPEIIQPKILMDPYLDKETGSIKIPAPIMLPITRLIDSFNSILLFSILCIDFQYNIFR